MNTIELNKDNFEATVNESGIVLVDFWASWCGPCMAFAPVFERSAAKHQDIKFAKVDTEREQELAGTLRISAIPTLMIFRDGVPIFAQAGALREAALDELIAKVRALDMEEVKREVAAAAKKPQGARASSPA